MHKNDIQNSLETCRISIIIRTVYDTPIIAIFKIHKPHDFPSNGLFKLWAC
jgi:hypothetical protein